MRLERYRPFDREVQERLAKALDPLFIYHSNAIEGNTLSLGDTIYFLNDRRLPGGKTEEEILEVKGQKAALEYVRDAVGSQFQFSEKLIREIHALLTRELPEEKYFLDDTNRARTPWSGLMGLDSHRSR